ncbi:MAG: hypothetical protein ACRD44_02800 [Bryobacteraceae bacterium]
MTTVVILAVLAQGAFLFTSFRSNGETGVYFALSDDGRKWTPLNDNQPWIKPEHAGILMRDPFLVRGGSGVWRLLWTWGWNRKETGGRLKIGYASSGDLITWRRYGIRSAGSGSSSGPPPSRDVSPIMKTRATRATTIASTRSPLAIGRRFLPRAYGLIPDSTASTPRSRPRATGGSWSSKDERRNPLQKKLRLAFAGSAAGPWSGITEPFTRDWVEGPSGVKIGQEWWVYFDHYQRPRHYGAVRTRDWRNFEDVTAELSFPDDHRHGTVVRISNNQARRLRAQRR